MSKKSKHKLMTSGYEKCPIDKEYSGPLIRHHINGRAVDDWDGPWNVAYISPNTHQLIHEGRLIIEGWFMTTDGMELIWHRTEDESITGRESTPPLIERK
jgi:hypothetical protein